MKRQHHSWNEPHFQLDIYAASDRGPVRKHNEDAFYLSTQNPIGLYAVADGMGGFQHGEQASRQLVEALAQLPPSQQLDEAAQYAKNQIIALNQRLWHTGQRQQSKMGTTLIVLLVDSQGQAHALWAGDSRLYRLHNDQLHQLTRDHSQVQKMLDYGILTEEEAATHPARNLLVNAVGVQEKVQIDEIRFQIKPGDRYLLCTDGISKPLNPQILQSALQQPNAQSCVHTLLEHAHAHGGQDNMTALCLYRLR